MTTRRRDIPKSAIAGFIAAVAVTAFTLQPPDSVSAEPDDSSPQAAADPDESSSQAAAQSDGSSPQASATSSHKWIERDKEYPEGDSDPELLGLVEEPELFAGSKEAQELAVQVRKMVPASYSITDEHTIRYGHLSVVEVVFENDTGQSLRVAQQALEESVDLNHADHNGALRSELGQAGEREFVKITNPELFEQVITVDPSGLMTLVVAHGVLPTGVEPPMTSDELLDLALRIE